MQLYKWLKLVFVALLDCEKINGFYWFLFTNSLNINIQFDTMRWKFWSCIQDIHIEWICCVLRKTKEDLYIYGNKK